MAALVSNIDEFDSSREEWTQYVERMDHFFAANSIEDAGKKKSTFLALIGPATYTLVRNLVSPNKPGDKSYDELVKALSDHFNPTTSETVQRSKFHSCVRRQRESIAAYVAKLRSLAEFCNFGTTLDDMLKDHLLLGVNNHKIQQAQLAEERLTLTKALKIAQSLETAAKNAKLLSQGNR